MAFKSNETNAPTEHALVGLDNRLSPPGNAVREQSSVRIGFGKILLHFVSTWKHVQN